VDAIYEDDAGADERRQMARVRIPTKPNSRLGWFAGRSREVR